eukprot:TRINITY_DN623_c0_g7_i2.p1 TRINITY_DN623_c0_g7~~TRINITY_DN623_c0_g7_i2.p1  ORF type:complete len:141 (+),score=35.04 TRINITY_DN623_c0_g7_i2:85-507(+)
MSRASIDQLSGWLKKEKQGFIHGWNKRWFIVQGDKLCYYHAPNESEAKDSIPLSDILSVTKSEDESNGIFEMMIEAKQRNFRLRAESKADLERWHTGLKTLARYAAIVSSAPPSVLAEVAAAAAASSSASAHVLCVDTTA